MRAEMYSCFAESFLLPFCLFHESLLISKISHAEEATYHLDRPRWSSIPGRAALLSPSVAKQVSSYQALSRLFKLTLLV
jgi:hypothetical protein